MDTQTLALNALHEALQAKTRAYAELSHRAAADGNSHLAVHAAWAADIAAVQATMWRNVISLTSNPAEMFGTLASAVDYALDQFDADETVARDAFDLITAARDALLSAFDPDGAAAVDAAFPSAGHLRGLPTPDGHQTLAILSARLGGRDTDSVVADLRVAAHDGVVVAAGLFRAGYERDALTQVWMADWAALEAFLIADAVAAGDHGLITVEMRWALVVHALAQPQVLPTGFTAAVAHLRATMISALGPIEGERLQAAFTPLPL